MIPIGALIYGLIGFGCLVLAVAFGMVAYRFRDSWMPPIAGWMRRWSTDEGSIIVAPTVVLRPGVFSAEEAIMFSTQFNPGTWKVLGSWFNFFDGLFLCFSVPVTKSIAVTRTAPMAIRATVEVDTVPEENEGDGSTGMLLVQNNFGTLIGM